MRTSAASCRQRSSTQPSRVYLIAFETRLREYLADERRIAVHAVVRRPRPRSSIPLLAATRRELAAQLLEQRRDLEVRDLGLDRAGLELADVEQRVQQPRHRADRLALVLQSLDRVAAL